MASFHSYQVAEQPGRKPRRNRQSDRRNIECKDTVESKGQAIFLKKYYNTH